VWGGDYEVAPHVLKYRVAKKIVVFMRRFMISAILAAICLLIVLVWSNKLLGGIEEMQAWGIGGNIIAISPDGKLLAATAVPKQERRIGNMSITGSTTVKLYAFPSGEVVRTFKAFYVTKLAFRER